MSYTQKIARNTMIQLAGKMLGLIFSILTLGLITRYLGPTGYGYYTTTLAFLQVFGILIDFGLQMITVQIISDPKFDESKIFSNIFTLRLCTSLVFFIAPLFALFFPYPGIVKIGIAINTLTYIFMAQSAVLVGLFQKHLRMGKVALADLLNKVIYFALVIIGVYLNKNLLWILCFGAATNGAYLVMLIYFANTLTKIKLLFEKDIWMLILSRSWPIALTIALNLVYFKADTIILSLFKTQDEVGLYGASYKILEVLINLSYLFLGLLLPLMTQSFAQKEFLRFKRVMQNGFDVMATISIPMIFATIMLGKRVMVMVAGSQYEASGSILQILILATGAIFIAAVFGYGIVAINKQKSMILFYAINAFLSLAAYLYFIPIYSYWAAAWITVLSEVFILFASLLVLYKNTQFLPKPSMLLKSLFASIAMCVPLYIFASLPLIFNMGIALSVYMASLYLVKGVSRETLMEIIKIKSQSR